MSTEANFARGTRYYYVHKATLACSFLGVAGTFPVFVKCPKPRSAFHRCAIVVIRTKREAAVLDAKMARRRKKAFARFERTVLHRKR